MIQINFKYQEKKNIIKCNNSDLFKNVCENFAKRLSLDIDNIFFIYKGEELNIELDFDIEQLFNQETKKKKTVEITVYHRKPFMVQFKYNNKDKILKFKEKDLLKNVLKRFEIQTKFDLSDSFILYNSRRLEPEDKEKTLTEIANLIDKKDKVMVLSVFDLQEKDISNEALDVINNSGSSSQTLIENRRANESLDPQFQEKKDFYLKNFMILNIQFISIIVLCALKYIPIIDKTLLEHKHSIIIYEYPSLVIIGSIMSFVINECLQENKTNKYMIIFLVFYPIFIIYSCLILSFYLHIKYITIGLGIIFAEILSLGIHINIFKNYSLLFFGISSSLLSLMVLILFSCLLIKSLLPIVYVSIFWLITNGYFILWIFLSGLLCKLDEFFYSVIIFNYSLFLGCVKILTYMFYGIKNLISIVLDYMKSTHFWLFFILLIQHIIITTFVWIGFSYGWNSKIKSEEFTFKFFIFFNIIIHFILCLLFYLAYNKTCELRRVGFLFLYFLYYPIMCIYYFSFSFFIEEKFILSFIFKKFFSLLFIVLYIFISKTDKWEGIFFPSVLMNIITSIALHFLWLEDYKAVINISTFSLIICDFNLAAFFNLGKKNEDLLLLTMNYGIFSVIFLFLYPLIEMALDKFVI